MQLNFTCDRFSLLFGSDWFFSGWPLCGIQVAAEKRNGLKSDCRRIASDVLAGLSSYWDADFSLARERETIDRLLQALRRAAIADDTFSKFADHFRGRSGQRIVSANHEALVLDLAALFVSESERSGGNGDPRIRRLASAVSLALSSCTSGRQIFDLWQKRSSEWDSWVSSLTPDLPDYVADYAVSLSKEVDVYMKFLATLMTSLSEEEFSEFDRWIIDAASDLAGIHIDGIRSCE